jgi:hypothetical protein
MEPVNLHIEYRISVYMRFRNDSKEFNPEHNRKPYFAIAMHLTDTSMTNFGEGDSPREAILDAMGVA